MSSPQCAINRIAFILSNSAALAGLAGTPLSRVMTLSSSLDSPLIENLVTPRSRFVLTLLATVRSSVNVNGKAR